MPKPRPLRGAHAQLRRNAPRAIMTETDAWCKAQAASGQRWVTRVLRDGVSVLSAASTTGTTRRPALPTSINARGQAAKQWVLARVRVYPPVVLAGATTRKRA